MDFMGYNFFDILIIQMASVLFYYSMYKIFHYFVYIPMIVKSFKAKDTKGRFYVNDFQGNRCQVNSYHSYNDALNACKYKDIQQLYRIYDRALHKTVGLSATKEQIRYRGNYQQNHIN